MNHKHMTRHERQPNRMTVVETVYYQAIDEQPFTVCNQGYTKIIRSNDEPYKRKVIIPADTVIPINKGWLTKVSFLHILVKGNYKPNLLADSNELPPCLELAICISLSERVNRTMHDPKPKDVIIPIARIMPGEPHKQECCDFDLLRLVNRTTEDITATVTLIPR